MCALGRGLSDDLPLTLTYIYESAIIVGCLVRRVRAPHKSVGLQGRWQKAHMYVWYVCVVCMCVCTCK